MNNLKPKNSIPPIKNSIILRQYAGLEYVTVTNIPVIRIGDSAPPSGIRTSSKINEAVAKSILEEGYAIHGKELRFFRIDLLGLSQEKFARELDVSSITILNWEKDSKRRLHLINELAVRALLAEKLNLNIKLNLLKTTMIPGEIEISAKNLILARHLY